MSSNEHSADCFRDGCEDTRIPPGNRGRKGVKRKGEVTAKEVSWGKEGERNELEGKEGVKDKKEEGGGEGSDGSQHCPEAFSITPWIR